MAAKISLEQIKLRTDGFYCVEWKGERCTGIAEPGRYLNTYSKLEVIRPLGAASCNVEILKYPFTFEISVFNFTSLHTPSYSL